MIFNISIIVVSILLAGSLVLFIPFKKNAIKLLLSFSGAFLLGVTVFNILPGIYTTGVNIMYAGGLILLGFLLQIILEIFSHGIEHGHVHTHHSHSKNYIYLLSVSLYIHSFLEGLPLGSHTHESEDLLWGIVIHNLPIAFSYAFLLRSEKFSNAKILFALLIFASITPAGMILGNYIQYNLAWKSFNSYALAMATGIFLHISTTIIFESGENHKYNIRKFIAILLGFAGSYVPHLFHQH
jgi:zinc and cadmium transporter